MPIHPSIPLPTRLGTIAANLAGARAAQAEFDGFLKIPGLPGDSTNEDHPNEIAERVTLRPHRATLTFRPQLPNGQVGTPVTTVINCP